MPRLTSINQIDPTMVPAIEERINAKLDQLPEKLIPKLLDDLGDPPNPENIPPEFATLVNMTIQDMVRQSVDKRFKNHIQRLVDKYPREIQAQLHDLPYIGGPPASWWAGKQRELENSLALFLVTAYGLSAKWHGMDQHVAEIQSAKYAREQARKVAAGFIENSKAKFEKLQSKWAGAVVAVGGLSTLSDNIKASKTTGPPASSTTENPGPPAKSEVRRQLKDIFSPSRIETMAVSEVTDAISHAGETTMQINGTTSDEDIWWTVGDDDVCEVCEPLHGQPRSVWAEKFPLGPKAHNKCRCRIGYAR